MISSQYSKALSVKSQVLGQLERLKTLDQTAADVNGKPDSVRIGAPLTYELDGRSVEKVRGHLTQQDTHGKDTDFYAVVTQDVRLGKDITTTFRYQERGDRASYGLYNGQGDGTEIREDLKTGVMTIFADNDFQTIEETSPP